MLAEERKKFIREKVLFEKNARELRNKPNRQEREEIKKLKEQVGFNIVYIQMYTDDFKFVS